MVALDSWKNRRPEEANLFNPAFLGSLTFEIAKEAEKSTQEGISLNYIPLILALSLHRPSRHRLPSTTVTSMYEWVQINEEVLIGLIERIHGLMPYVQETLRFSLHQNTLQIGSGHYIKTGKMKSHFPGPFLRGTTDEVREIVKKTRFLCRWLLKSGNEASVLSCWGVRP
ncbi:DUF6521 family protein [Aliiroseovarius sp. KMU-50]|uniref:DUF6521 family protein n=1 Tax=Aliiroseovarius salicola TaxID=3009082 RepID=A0ABT4W3C1_9RHOB|nr:three component ABC system middle component [Aliiroseovarius sp. KMU-50]MDA5095022.1 DUF6521 family protein [Aliiroseovarius sp. KMU-50]